MSLKIDIPQPELLKPKITIFGVGGAGGNAINNMIRSSLEGVEFVAANTDAQALQNSLADNRIQLGLKTTKGLGAGSFPDRGRAAAEENVEEIEKYLEGSNMVFIAAGMGGGTGTGAAPVIAKLAREREILTVGVVTKPFHFEGKYRMETAGQGIDELKKYVDTLIVIPNQNLFRIANEHTTFESAFKMADDVLHAGVRGITDLITMPGLVNLDFADIRTIMTKMGKAMMGTGEATGENRAIAACEAAVSNPLLDDISIRGAKGVLVNMTGGPDMTLFEADMAVNAIKKEVDPNANIIFGSAFNENMKGRIRISVVATGIDADEYKKEILRNHENHEPSRFTIDNKQTQNKTETKNFFDPGAPTKPHIEEVEEISTSNFKPKKSYSSEENLDYGKVEHTKKTDFEGFTQVSFKQNELEKEVELEHQVEEKITFNFDEEDKNSTSKTLSKTNATPKQKAIKTKKETSSSTTSFGLFSFMNPKKREEHDKEESIPIKKSRSENDSFINTNKLQPQDEEEISLKSNEAEKKRREFFGSTLFDKEEQSSSLAGNHEEDDILNVPAFFRRKK